MTNDSFSSSIPLASWIVPPESDKETTLPPRWFTFSVAYCATFPEPEIVTVLPLNESSFVFSISSAK